MNKKNITRYTTLSQQNLKDEFSRLSGLRTGGIQSNWRSARREIDEMRPRKFNHYTISHLFDGRGVLYVNDQRYDLAPGDAVIMLPGITQDYFGYKHYYFEDAIGFSGALPDSLVEQGLLHAGKITLGLERCLLPVIQNVLSTDRARQLNAHYALGVLLTEICRSQATSISASKIELLANDILNSPEKKRTIQDMARFCCLSEVQFRRVFKQKFKMSPKQYYDQIRINTAARMVEKTELPLSEIAARFNYADQFHFSRCFVQHFGYPPVDFRRRAKIV